MKPPKINRFDKTVILEVEISTEFKLRLAIAKILLRLAAIVLDCEIIIKEEKLTGHEKSNDIPVQQGIG